jgi:hypothetical protein
MHFKPYTVLTSVQSILLGKLEQSLHTTDFGTYWGDDIEFLLWVLVTAAAVEDGARVWFVGLLNLIIICVQRSTSETGCPVTSRGVWGRAKLWIYYIRGPCLTAESISSISERAVRPVTIYLPRRLG